MVYTMRRMKYVALLRGINVGGNGMIKMADLKAAFEKSGYMNVVTYINSGNVIFESEETNTGTITARLEKDLSQTFRLDLRLVIIPRERFEDVVAHVPDAWNKGADLRCYVAFIKEPVTPAQAIPEMKPKDGVDFVSTGPGVVYLSTKLSGLTKSGFTKLAGTPVYKHMTMRNYTTVRKILGLMK